MKTYFRIFYLFFICLIVIPWTFSSCNSENKTDSIEPTYWIIDPPNVFNTNNIKKAQEEIPFKIIFPTYFPDNLKPYPSIISGPIKDTVSRAEVALNMQYQKKEEGTYLVYISEEGSPINVIPADGSKVTNLVFLGVQVLEEETQDIILPATGGQEAVPSLHYYWNRDNIHYEVNIQEYASEVSRKIIESMIK
jgi:hypothetical protein